MVQLRGEVAGKDRLEDLPRRLLVDVIDLCGAKRFRFVHILLDRGFELAGQEADARAASARSSTDIACVSTISFLPNSIMGRMRSTTRRCAITDLNSL